MLLDDRSGTGWLPPKEKIMADKLIIVMANTDPRNGEELGAPIFQATVAAAMDYDVDVICTATSGRLMKKGVAEELFVKEGSPKSVYSFIQETCICHELIRTLGCIFILSHSDSSCISSLHGLFDH